MSSSLDQVPPEGKDLTNTEMPSPSPALSEKSTKPVTKPFSPDWRFFVAISSLSVITLMAALDATSLTVALPVMARLLKGTAIETFWAGTSFSLTSTVFQPPIGALSHIFGRKPLLYTSLLFFGAGSIAAAVANNFTVVLVGRSLQGIGGGGIITLTEIVVTDLVPLRLRGKYFAMISSMWAIGTVIGPLVGGGFAQNVTWRWVFWINLPFIGVGVFMIAFFLKLNFIPSSFAAKLRRVDWVGTVVFIAALTGLLIPLSWGGVMYSWSSWHTLVPLVICAVALIGFVIYEEYVPAEPLIRTSVFKNRSAAISYFGIFIHGLVLWCTMYYLPLYYQVVKGFNPIMSGVSLFPQSFTIAPASMASGFIIARTGRYRWSSWTGWVISTLGFGIMILLDIHTSTAGWIFINVVPGLGIGLLFSALPMAIQASTSSEDAGYAVNMFAFLRTFGQTVGIAIGGVVFQNSMKRKLLTFPLLASRADEIARNANGLVQVVKAMPAGLEKSQILESYVYGLRIVFVVCTIFAGVALFASLWIKEFPLDRELVTEQGYAGKPRSTDAEKNDTNDTNQV